MGAWDFALLAVVTLQVTAIAYFPRPRWKALALSLPFPFTTIALAQAQPINATHILALGLLLLYFHGIRLLHLRLPIVLALAIGLAGYITLSRLLLQVAATTPLPFWLVALVIAALALTLYFLQPSRPEPDHRTPLPIYYKLPTIGLIVGLLLLVKDSLQGFATLFPIIGVVGAYEARKGLWAVCRQVPVLVAGMTAMLAATYLAQETLGLAKGLLVGWVVYLAILWPLTVRLWTREALALDQQNAST